MLARALSPPTRTLCTAIADGLFCLAVQEALARIPAVHRMRFDASLACKLAVGEDVDTLSDAMLIEYTRLFSTGLLCPHYEADFVAADSFRSMHIIADVARMYAAFGVRVANMAAERPDHIAVELEFMNWLASKEGYAAQHRQIGNVKLCRRAQRLFFQEHLGCWGRAAARTLREAAKLGFYQGIGELLERLLGAEAQFLHVELNTTEMQGHALASGQHVNAAEKSACEQCSCDK
jgi:TorA maturation chaperone TorD